MKEAFIYLWPLRKCQTKAKHNGQPKKPGTGDVYYQSLLLS